MAIACVQYTFRLQPACSCLQLPTLWAGCDLAVASCKTCCMGITTSRRLLCNHYLGCEMLVACLPGADVASSAMAAFTPVFTVVLKQPLRFSPSMERIVFQHALRYVYHRMWVARELKPRARSKPQESQKYMTAEKLVGWEFSMQASHATCQS